MGNLFFKCNASMTSLCVCPVVTFEGGRFLLPESLQRWGHLRCSWDEIIWMSVIHWFHFWEMASGTGMSQGERIFQSSCSMSLEVMVAGENRPKISNVWAGTEAMSRFVAGTLGSTCGTETWKLSLLTSQWIPCVLDAERGDGMGRLANSFRTSGIVSRKGMQSLSQFRTSASSWCPELGQTLHDLDQGTIP